MSGVLAWPFERSPFDVAKRMALWFICGCICMSGYGIAKLMPFGPPMYLELTSWDRAIPFLPWTIWPYSTITWGSLLAWLCVPNRVEGRRLFFSMVLACLVCWVFFAFFPTTYPRFLYPLPDIDNATIREFAELRASDTPSHCFPSMHVALAWSIGLTWASFLNRRWAQFGVICWAIGVSVFTLTTKQHYIVDVPAGFIVGAGAWWVVRRGVHDQVVNAWSRVNAPLRLSRDTDRQLVARMLARVQAHQWSLSDIAWPTDQQPALDPLMVRLLNQVIYVEEIAALNFDFEQKASADADLAALYGLFATEERRHAEGLRTVLALHGHNLEPPGLGNALVLDQFDTLNPESDADWILVAASTPVFETFLDAGTIPFLQKHPSLQSPAFDAFVDLVCSDEAQHIALNWLVTREAARQNQGLSGLRLLFNPNIYRGMVAVPWMSLDVYSLAYRLGYKFDVLLPAFGKLWRLHRRYPELNGFILWWNYRLFVFCGAIATATCVGLVRTGLMWGALWTTVTAVTDRVAWMLFGPSLLQRRGLPSLTGETAPNAKAKAA